MLPVKQFVEFIEINKLFDADTKILAAVSGGMDSVLMAHLLNAAGYNFAIAHCNFMLRGDEALADQQFTRCLAQQLGVTLHTTNFDTKTHASQNRVSIQMAARHLRYQWFNQLCETGGYRVISLAHHQNDAIETILLNLTRGTGIAGLHGILPLSGNLVRPLLFLNRDEIEAVVEQEDLAFVEDSSNASIKYARNKIRHEVVPVLKELNPSIEKTFERNLKVFRDLEVLLNQQTDLIKEKIMFVHNNEVHISIADIKALNPQRLLLFKLLQPYGFIDTMVDDLISSLDKHAGRVFENGEYTLVLDRERVIISKRKNALAEEVAINPTDKNIVYNNYKLALLHEDSALIVKSNPMTVSVDAELLVYPLTIRPWQRGDQFYPLGMKTRQKLSDFFIHQKVPLNRKNEVPVLVNGNGDIIWVGGYRLSERYKVSANTKKVIIFELIKL
ncbi:tRNA lysidine(34) synthetase TilS [Mucilaginibacter glaciei]|uniref:tRNA(Ile)-lysidine synthase n=1 Tax=Mucilaginibacter glaciei TaxID=2772109 RepID=A0A926S6T8_9SPHI|nr:tRNA lysidine(34) synthetase TilS [Mucilaginibacter glaciei]MBD1394046.1 tRNA lysidine(34) synthetase TilS [Mucilaginibacter glaciei]